MALSLKDYLWMRSFGYRPDIHSEDIGWTTVHTHGIITVPIARLRASILTDQGRERRMIAETPHFAWIQHLVEGGDDPATRQVYIDYMERYFPDVDLPTVLAGIRKKVSAMVAEAGEDGSIVITTSKPKRRAHIGPYILKIYDGVHRSATALAMGHQYIQCRIK